MTRMSVAQATIGLLYIVVIKSFICTVHIFADLFLSLIDISY